MPNSPLTGAVLFSKKTGRMARFYEAVLSMPVVVARHDHVILESATFQLIIHGIPEHIAQGIDIKSPPTLREEAPVKMFFNVASIDAARAKAADLGGHVDAQEQELVARFFKACDGYDPEGNVFQLRQRL